MGEIENKWKCEKCGKFKKVGTGVVCTAGVQEIAIYYKGRIPCEGIVPINKTFDLASH